MTKKNPSLDHKDFEQKVEKLLIFLQIPYNNLSLYIQSFVHKSVLNEKSTSFTSSNERLEFFGDAVLELAITEMLFFNFPNKEEGELTDIRSALVRGKNLANISKALNFNEYIVLSRGEILAGGNENPYIMANTLEAFLGAIYVDLGYIISKQFVLDHIYKTLDEILDLSLHIDPKSQLQEIVQSKYTFTPNYEVLEETGMDHDKNYKIGVYLFDKIIGEGSGSSKKKAQKNAAENALLKTDEWMNII
ncbi:MAG: ribonuclease III [Candidatus Gracilibacteria bacterium]|nr:ribonuclease III [Candidatus Gracilibacteria bacterium]MDD2908292.1 ribonuclease III [Candidatus Gracilibacteria bacterium]